MVDTVKKLVILGSTGSIGSQTLDIVRKYPQRYRVVGLAGGNNRSLLDQQVDEFKPDYIYHVGIDRAGTNARPKTMSLEAMAELPEADLVVMAISGNAGIVPTFAAVKAGKMIALANKESMVAAGELITGAAEKSRTKILPVDSEHSAIWQCLAGEESKPSRLILTASGGPFRRYKKEELVKVTPEQALRHPSWNMGKKVTIDSATLMNKGLEIIEAHWLFNMPFEWISVIIHPQSIVHSMVEFADGAVKAQLGYPDMRLPIQYALSFPERLPNQDLPKLDFTTMKSLVFEPPDFQAFPCLNLAVEAGKRGGTYPAVLSAADECAVTWFLEGRIGFTDIPRLVEDALSAHKAVEYPGIEDIRDAGEWVRRRFASN
jgi:1-deoxy-D-xylulose-5-phosphate reductoisomerase